MEEAIKNRNDFAYEGHFTNEATWEVPKRFKSAGYLIHLIFLGLVNTDLSELRVIDRTKEGGHYVDPVTVAANFYGNLEKLNKHFTIFDSLHIIDTSETAHNLLCVLKNNQVKFAVFSEDLPNWFQENLHS